MKEESPLVRKVIGCAIEVHRELGPGPLESTYEQCLARELALTNIPFLLQAQLPVHYKGTKIDCGYRIDMVIGGRIRHGLLITFNVRLLRDGLRSFLLD